MWSPPEEPVDPVPRLGPSGQHVCLRSGPQVPNDRTAKNDVAASDQNSGQPADGSDWCEVRTKRGLRRAASLPQAPAPQLRDRRLEWSEGNRFADGFAEVAGANALLEVTDFVADAFHESRPQRPTPRPPPSSESVELSTSTARSGREGGTARDGAREPNAPKQARATQSCPLVTTKGPSRCGSRITCSPYADTRARAQEGRCRRYSPEPQQCHRRQYSKGDGTFPQCRAGPLRRRTQRQGLDSPCSGCHLAGDPARSTALATEMYAPAAPLMGECEIAVQGPPWAVQAPFALGSAAEQASPCARPHGDHRAGRC